jgi:hypothetical protein
MAKLSQAQALMEVSSAEGDAKSQSHISSSAPASGALTPALSTPTENDALLAKRAFLQQQIEMKKMELLMQTEQAEREQVEDVRDAAPAQMNSTLEAEAGSGLQLENSVVLDNSQHILEQQKRLIAMQIIQKHKVLREKVLEESRRDSLAAAARSASCGQHVSPPPMENDDHLRGNTTDIISEVSNFQYLGTAHDTSVLQRASPPVIVQPVPMPSYSSAPDINANAAHTRPSGMPTAVKIPAVELTPAAAMENFSAAELLKKLDLARAAKTAPLSLSSATLPKDASLNLPVPKASSQSESSVTSATAASLPSSSKTTKVSANMPAEGNKIVHLDETVPHHPAALQAVSLSASIPKAAPQCAPSLPTPKAASSLGHNRMVNQDQAARLEAGNNSNHMARQVKGVCAICRSPVFVDQERMKDQQGSYVHAQCSSMPSDSSAPDLNANAAHTRPPGIQTAVKIPAVELTPTTAMENFSGAQLLKELDLARAAKTAPLSLSSATLPKDASLNLPVPKAASQSESSVTSATAASLPSSSKTTKVSANMPAEGNKKVHSDETVPHHPAALQAVSLSASIPKAAPQCAPSLPTPKAASPLGHNRMVNQDQAARLEAGNNANHMARQVKGVCAICRSPVFVDQERMKDQQGSYVHAQCSSMPSDSSAPDLNANAAHKAAMAALPQSSSVSVQVSPKLSADVNEILYSDKTIMHPPVGAGRQRPAVDEPSVSITGATGKSTPVVMARATGARSTIVDDTAIVISESPSHRWTAHQIVNSPLRMRLKMPEDRLLAAFKYANWFAYWILFWATCAFFFGIFSPFGFPCWGVSVPLFSFVGLLFGYCLPTQPPDDGKTMPRSIRILTTLIMMWAAASAFTAGILSAFSVESIRPLLLTPVCMSTTELNSTSPLPQSPSSPVETNVAAATPTLNATQAHTTQAESTDEEKLRSCKAWNMCNDGGIKMLSCGRLMVFVQVNA